MNKPLINKLAEQAKNKVQQDKYQVNAWIHEYNEQFARLIVQRCISEIALMGVQQYENIDISWSCRVVINNLKETFGINHE
jgi:hypothetical protein